MVPGLLHQMINKCKAILISRVFFRREKSLEAYQAQTTCIVRMQHEIKTLRAIVSSTFMYRAV